LGLPVDLPRNKRIEISLTFIFGIGCVRTLEICKKASLDPRSRTEHISESEPIKLREVIERDYEVDGPRTGPQRAS
jgi:small subunit ribosomal protein S13